MDAPSAPRRPEDSCNLSADVSLAPLTFLRNSRLAAWAASSDAASAARKRPVAPGSSRIVQSPWRTTRPFAGTSTPGPLRGLSDPAVMAIAAPSAITAPRAHRRIGFEFKVGKRRRAPPFLAASALAGLGDGECSAQAKRVATVSQETPWTSIPRAGGRSVRPRRLGERQRRALRVAHYGLP